MQVPFIDLKQRWASEKSDLMPIIEKTLDSGNLILGDSVREFEEAMEHHTRAKHAIGLNSGTDALVFALWSAGVTAGDEVITSPISFVATVAAITHVGATPIFCDVGKDGLIDVDKIESRITRKTRAIIPVHWAGKMCEMWKLCEIAEKHKLLIIEDAAQAMGSFYMRQSGDKMYRSHGGSIGLSSAISCHPLKNLNALGDGGVMLTNDDDVARIVRLYRNHGMESRDNVVLYGMNSRLDALNAEVLKYRLTKLEGIIARRRANANIYREQIETDQVYMPPEVHQDSYVMFIAQCQNRDGLKAHLTEHGIESMIYYGTPLHLHKAAEEFKNERGDYPVAEKMCDEVLALPIQQHLTPEQISFVAEKINEFYKAT